MLLSVAHDGLTRAAAAVHWHSLCAVAAPVPVAHRQAPRATMVRMRLQTGFRAQCQVPAVIAVAIVVAPHADAVFVQALNWVSVRNRFILYDHAFPGVLLCCKFDGNA